MTLKDIENIVDELFKKHKIYELGWVFKWDNAQRRYGCCHFDSKRITLSKHLNVRRKEKNIKNTILHEIAHILAGYENGHNEVWQKIAKKIGCSANRTSLDIKPYFKYKGECPSCGNISFRHRLPKSKRVSCAKCSPKFNDKFIFNWKINDEIQ